jgi:hypothetical protein
MVDKSVIIFCLVTNAALITLFSTGLVEVGLNASSTVIALAQAGCLTQLLQSNIYQSFTETFSVSNAVLGTH